MAMIDISNIYPDIMGGRDLPKIYDDTPTYDEAMGASLGRFRNAFSSPLNINDTLYDYDPDFDVAQSIFDLDPSYHEYSMNLIFAQNQNHLDHLIEKIDRSKEDQEILSRATIGQLAFVSLFDPINLIALPVGVGVGAMRAGFQVGKATMMLTAAEEAVLSSIDPVQRDLQKSAINIGVSGLAGYTLGSIVGFATTSSSGRVIKSIADETEEAENALTPAKVVDEDAAPIIVDESFDKTQRISDYGEIPSVPKPEPQGDPSLVQNVFTSSFIFKAATSGYKRIMGAKDVPTDFKKFYYDLVGDQGQLAVGHVNGHTLGISVFMDQAKYQAEMYKFYKNLQKSFVKESKKPVVFALDYAVGRQRDFNAFIKEVGMMRLNNRKPQTQAQEEAMQLINDFAETWRERLTETDLIGSAKFYRKQMKFFTKRIEDNEARIEKLRSEGMRSSHPYYQRVLARIDKYKNERLHAQDVLEDLKDMDVLPAGEKVFHPRFFLVDEIKKRREEFEKILMDWFTANPSIKVFDPRDPLSVQKLSTDPAKVAERVKRTVDKIISDGADNDFENGFFGYGASKHFMHRRLDIPNHLVADFIETNPFTAFMAYNQRVAPRYSFAKKFGGKSIDELLEEKTDELFDAGMDIDRINAVLADFRTDYDRVMNAPLRNPSRWDARVARRLKDLATFNFMGAVGFTTITEFGRLMAEHGVNRVMRTMIAKYTDDKIRLAAAEGPKASEGIEGAMHSSAIRYSDEMLTNPQMHGLWEQGKEAFYILNGLTPVTRFLKHLDAIMRQDQLIQFAIKEAAGEADDWMSQYLRRYGLSKADAKKLASNKGTAWQESDAGLIYANTDEWTDEALKERFQRAMSTGILNTIMNATPADRPRIMDGVALIPMRVARRFGMDEDPKYKGYARMESALLSLPFQFYGFALAAINKTTAAYTTGQMRSPLFGAIWMMGLGYAVLEIKSNFSSGSKRAWDGMPFTDKLIRSFDQSGLAALYSDMFYTSISSSMAMTGENYLDGYVKPKFPEKQGFFNSVNQFAGAGPSVSQDYYNAFNGLINGEKGSVEQAAKMIPGMRLWFMRYLVNSMQNAFDYESKDTISGYGRY
tara:strand:- start:342 stop:3632 length:3291 start_codon:yes stop_codon:yes gene_type:complete